MLPREDLRWRTLSLDIAWALRASCRQPMGAAPEASLVLRRRLERSSSKTLAAPAGRATSSSLKTSEMSRSICPYSPQEGKARIIRTHVSSSAGTPCSKNRPISRMFAESSVRADPTATAARWPCMACVYFPSAFFVSRLRFAPAAICRSITSIGSPCAATPSVLPMLEGTTEHKSNLGLLRAASLQQLHATWSRRASTTRCATSPSRP